jgi:branched-chain amino acid aminotransferase
MAAVVNINGKIFSENEALISVFDHGFLYGEGVYETVRTYGRVLFLFDRHMRRLRQSALMIDLEVPLTDAQFFDRVHETMEASSGTGELYVRIMLTRGPGELTYDPAACPTPSVVIIAKPFVGPPQKFYTEGITVSIVSTARSQPSSLSPLVKSNNLLTNALAMREALRRGASEGLMLNYRGELTECSQSNFFIVKGREVTTPPLDSGLLAGTTRAFVIELGAGLGIIVHEAVLRVPDLLDADEMFLTSTTREIVPVVRVDNHLIGDGRPGTITKRLLEEFRRRTQASANRG